MPRIPYPDPASLPPDVSAILAARPRRNVFQMLAHAPALTPGIMELTGAILYRAKLDASTRELLILRVGHLCRSQYEVHQHRKIAAAIGLSPEQIDGTAREPDPAVYGPRELIVLRLAGQVVRQVKADAALFDAAVEAFGHEQAVEILVVIGTYVMLAQVLENTEVEVEEGGGPAQEDVTRIFGGQA
jgi:4-carboxymuconolactone decarboxylase